MLVQSTAPPLPPVAQTVDDLNEASLKLAELLAQREADDERNFQLAILLAQQDEAITSSTSVEASDPLEDEQLASVLRASLEAPQPRSPSVTPVEAKAKHEKGPTEREPADHVNSTDQGAEWLCETERGRVSYSELSSQIEQAYARGKATFEFQRKDGHDYAIDFAAMTQTRGNGYGTVRGVVRFGGAAITAPQSNASQKSAKESGEESFEAVRTKAAEEELSRK